MGVLKVTFCDILIILAYNVSEVLYEVMVVCRSVRACVCVQSCWCVCACEPVSESRFLVCLEYTCHQ